MSKEALYELQSDFQRMLDDNMREFVAMAQEVASRPATLIALAEVLHSSLVDVTWSLSDIRKKREGGL